MKHTKATPGPWRLKRHKSGLLSIMGGNTNPDMENGKSVIAEVYPAHVPLSALHPDEIEANARLIAAAPALADAMRGMRARLASLWAQLKVGKISHAEAAKLTLGIQVDLASALKPLED